MLNGVPVQTGLLSAKDVEISRNTDSDSEFSNPYNSRAAVRGSERVNIVLDNPANGKQFNGSTTGTVPLGYGSYC